MKAQKCELCELQKIRTQGWIDLQFHDTNTGVKRKATICNECQDKTMKKIIYEVRALCISQ